MSTETREPKEDGAMKLDEVIPLADVAKQYGVALRTLEDRKWRERVGLPVVKLGGKIVGVRPEDLAAVLRRGFESAKAST